jgi:hypothetical protein
VNGEEARVMIESSRASSHASTFINIPCMSPYTASLRTGWRQRCNLLQHTYIYMQEALATMVESQPPIRLAFHPP